MYDRHKSEAQNVPAFAKLRYLPIWRCLVMYRLVGVMMCSRTTMVETVLVVQYSKFHLLANAVPSPLTWSADMLRLVLLQKVIIIAIVQILSAFPVPCTLPLISTRSYVVMLSMISTTSPLKVIFRFLTKHLYHLSDLI